MVVECSNSVAYQYLEMSDGARRTYAMHNPPHPPAPSPPKEEKGRE